ncbi:MAG: hypothetical protein ACRCUT_13475 [Spirochaetota bacterium]
MEIRNDINAPARIQTVHASHGGAPASAPASAGIDSSFSPSPDMRDLSNAMMILQTANAIIQQALTVSGKLRTMAQSTMATGQTDMQEISRSLAEINSSLQGQTVNAPVIKEMPKDAENVRIDKEIASMEKMADTGKADKEQADAVYESLVKKQGEVRERIDTAAEQMGAKGYSYEAAPARSADLSREIVNNFSGALSAQGNIRSETAGILLG